MSETTHMSEWGVAVILHSMGKLYTVPIVDRIGLRATATACSGMSDMHSFVYAQTPTCPRCAVLLDEVLETGRVPLGVGFMRSRP